MKKHSGFTLIELMVTLAVAAILITVAVPSLRTIIQNNRITTQTNELVTAFNLARSEAIKRATLISVCASSTGVSCAGNWEQGWIVFTDPGNDGAVTAGTDEILRVWDALTGGTTITAATNGGAAISDFRYDRLGAASLTGAFVFNIPDCTGNQKRTVQVANSGRVSTSRSACP